MAPDIHASTRDERLAYVRKRYQCISDCDLCGICKIFHGLDVEQALEAYIDGREDLATVLKGLRGR